MTEAIPKAQVADELCEDCGYEPELERTLGSFQVFAVSFAFISVAVGIFGTYDDVLQNAGPVGIWLWPIVGVGQTLIALVIAQFAARIPLSGSSYQWASRLANPKVGWFFGWLAFCYLATGVVACDDALANTAIMPPLPFLLTMTLPPSSCNCCRVCSAESTLGVSAWAAPASPIPMAASTGAASVANAIFVVRRCSRCPLSF